MNAPDEPVRGATTRFWTYVLTTGGRRLFGWIFPYLITSVPRVVAEDLTQMTWRSSTSTIWEVIYGDDLAADVWRIPASIPFLCLHGDRDDSAPRVRSQIASAIAA